jgi:hypothetical protein
MELTIQRLIVYDDFSLKEWTNRMIFVPKSRALG